MLTAKQYSERKRKRKAEEDIFSQQPSNPSSLTRPHIAQVSSRSALGVATTSIYINNVAQPSPSNILNSEEVFKTKAEPQKSEVEETLQEFEEKKQILLDYIFERDYHPLVGELCECKRAKRLVCCEECLGHRAMCAYCFIDSHAARPCHWAKVWQEEGGYFSRRDISALPIDVQYAIPLGHGGGRCPTPEGYKENHINFRIIDHNGVHETRIHYCICHGDPNRVQQLLQFGLFPATLTMPKIAFTLTVVHQFHIHHLESKQSTYDYIGSLRRLTDNIFASEVKDPYPQFLNVMKFWRVLAATKRLGQAHGIDSLFPNRPAGSLLVYCVACPEKGHNMEARWEETPDEYKHLNQIQLTVDGNFHANRYKKNSSDKDHSLFGGLAYYPSADVYTEYLRSLPAQDHLEKSGGGDCPLRAIQNRAHTPEHLAVSGIIITACGHIVVRACVDTQKGERFANTDYALAMTLCQMKDQSIIDEQYVTSKDFLFSYDISCAYLVNIIDRFKARFPDLVSMVERFRFLVPLVHVHNHKENCTYRFSSAYIEGAGHFHGETVEHPWAELNQVAPQTRQMSAGHRHDTIIDHHGDWNFKKVVNMASSLYVALQYAKEQFRRKRENHLALSVLNYDRLQEWQAMDRRARTLNSNKQIECVYRVAGGKVPSQAKIYEDLVNKFKASSASKTTDISTTLFQKGARFLNEGLDLEFRQIKLAYKIKNDPHCSSVELSKRREKLGSSLSKWKDIRNEVLGQVVNLLSTDLSKSCIDEPETWNLMLPSSWSSEQQMKHELGMLADAEVKLRKGVLFDSIRLIRSTVKALSILRSEKSSNARSTSARTRATARIDECEQKLGVQIATYNKSREALASLRGSDYSEGFPTMTLEDTYRLPSAHTRREIGASRMPGGRPWNNGINAGAPVTTQAFISVTDIGAEKVVKTSGNTVKTRKDKKAFKDKSGANRGLATGTVIIDSDKAEESPKLAQDGWIWRLGTITDDLSPDQIKKWSDESDSVMWFRSEAEMHRWQEEVEIRQADFLRCIRAFGSLSAKWSQLAEMNKTSPGRVAYARKTSARYAVLQKQAKDLFCSAGYKSRLKQCEDDSVLLADLIHGDRKNENVSFARDLADQVCRGEREYNL